MIIAVNVVIVINYSLLCEIESFEVLAPMAVPSIDKTEEPALGRIG